MLGFGFGLLVGFFVGGVWIGYLRDVEGLNE